MPGLIGENVKLTDVIGFGFAFLGTAFMWRHQEIPARVHRVHLGTGERTPWRELTPPDPTGIYRIGRLHISADGSAYAYTYYMHLLDLHVIEGLR